MAAVRKRNTLKSSLKMLQKMKRMVTKFRAKLNRSKQRQEKQIAKVKRKERTCAKRRRLNEFLFKEDECIQTVIGLTLDIIEAEDEHDFVRADLLKQLRSELVTNHMVVTRAFFTGGQQ